MPYHAHLSCWKETENFFIWRQEHTVLANFNLTAIRCDPMIYSRPPSGMFSYLTTLVSPLLLLSLVRRGLSVLAPDLVYVRT